jgi:hypothetical protein
MAKRNYLIFDDNLIISGTNIPPCKITETTLTLKEFIKISQEALYNANIYSPPGGRSVLENRLV